MGNSKKSFIMLSILSLVLVGMILFRVSPLANATGETITTTGDFITQVSSQKDSIGKFEEVSETVQLDEGETSSKHSLGVDNSVNLNLEVGASWTDSFKINNLTNVEHNALNINISNVTSGKYKVIITATNGYQFESPEYLSGSITTIKNVNPDVTYNATIINTSASTLKATADVASYF